MSYVSTYLTFVKEFVAASYQRAINTLKVELGKNKPDFAFVLPGDKAPKNSHFLVNPIDGIANFAHAFPQFAINVAVVENGVLSAAVIYTPVTDELFFAEK